MRLAILVTAPAYGSQGSASAYMFTQAAIEMGHEIQGIFFYQQGVTNANNFTTPASDEDDLVKLWQTLAVAHGFSLDVCISAALRRGVVDSVSAQEQQLAAANLQAPFAMTGLGQLAELSSRADRLVQF
ncbi:sulfurtransferase complex subunit TusD [Motilimonas sp. 1_MG-2023]|uniref:sulfurtransferase complex subunit TusD n=1 Tax=Motilimonas TaxID=1914248 RepID=UPI0026E2E767|nr:sulfurtransferase complex subunit TusD [Motilimonas sp. 1_MG-2023]MDO6527984.1 sulfurtransferase complex subunit TusD [Motilimonas sp. 1_MG-2023]